MKKIQRAIAISSLLTVLAVSPLFGQARRQSGIGIPFAFSVGDKVLPAGDYRIEKNRRDSDTVWVVRNTDNNETAVLMTIPVRANATQEKTKLVFHRYADLYFLSEFWEAGTNTGREVRASKGERSLEEMLAMEPQEYVLIAGTD